MPRARSKQQLLEFGEKEYTRLMSLLDNLNEGQLTQQPVYDNRTCKDILAHLYAWHLLFLTWYEEGMAGGKPVKPAPGYTFTDTPALNEKLYQDYKDMPWEEVLGKFIASHEKVMGIIEGHSPAELEEMGKFAWTGSTNMASYLASATSSHYQWASELIRKTRFDQRKMS